MVRLGRKNWILLMVISLCLASLSSTVLAANIAPQAAKQQTAKQTFKKVSIDQNSYIELKDIHLMENSNNNVIAFTISVYNGRNNDLQFIDYWARVKTKSGTSYAVYLMNEGKNEVIPSKSSRTYTFYTTVAKHIKLSDIIIQFVRWDFTNPPDYFRVLGEITIPASYTSVTNANAKKEIEIDQVPISTRIENIQISRGDTSYSVQLDFIMNNQGSRAVALPQFKYFIRTSEGLLYELYPPAADTNNATSIQPRIEEKKTLKGVVPVDLEKKNWQLYLAVQPEEKNIDVPLAQYQIPVEQAESQAVAPNEVYKLTVNNQPVETKVSRVIHGANEITIYFSFTNKGSERVEIKDYVFDLKTASNELYPLAANMEEALLIDPLTSKELRLTASIPIQVNQEQLDLVMNKKEENNKFTVATFDVSENSSGNPNAMEQLYANAHGIYGVRINQLQRLPHGQMDIIAANVTISNRSSNVLPLLNLGGQFVLDGISFKESDTKIVQLDQLANLQPYSSMDYIMYIKVPYTYQFADIKIILQEKDGENSLRTIAEINQTNDQFEIPAVTSGRTYQFDHVGNSASVGVKTVHTYEGTSSSIFYAELEVQNDETRYTKLPEFMGYIRTKDGIDVPAQITKVEQQIMPKGKVLLALWGKVPAGSSIEEAQIMLGKKHVDEEEEQMIQAVRLELPPERSLPLQRIDNLKLYPYTIQIDELRGVVSGSQRSIVFDYAIKKANDYEAVPEPHSLLFEVVDGNLRYEHELKLESDLQVIENGTAQFNVASIDFIKRPSKTSNFEVRIYDQFEGHKKLVAVAFTYWTRELF